MLRCRLFFAVCLVLPIFVGEASAREARVVVPAADGWTTCRTENFALVVRSDRPTAVAWGETCEATRRELVARWFDATDERPADAWSPVCEVVLHATWESYAAATGDLRGQTSGASTGRVDGGKVVRRRIDLCPDPARARAALAHEMTHLLMLQRFPELVLPRWLDEGIAGGMDPLPKRAAFARRLKTTCGPGGRLDLLPLLASAEYPDRDLETFYAKSLLVVEHLVAAKGETRFLAFVERLAAAGAERALHEHYDGLTIAELERELLRRLAD